MDEVLELENLQFLGIYGILQETYKLINKWRKIFTQITLAFILPLSLLLFINMEISNFFLKKIFTQEKNYTLQHTQKTTPQFLKLSNNISIIFIFVSIIFSSIVSLLPASAVIYAVAAIYTARDVSFKRVKVVPKVWKRLVITFLCIFGTFLAFNFVAFSMLFLIPVVAILIYGPNDHNFAASIETILFFFFIFYFFAILYLSMIWQLSNVVSVLEDRCGFKAMAKSKALIKGKMGMVTKLTMLLSLPLGIMGQFVFYFLVLRSALVGMVGRGILGIMWILGFLLFFLFKLVAETVVYFVCKSDHCESVNKLALSDHLQGYLFTDHYVQLKLDDDVQLNKLQVV